MDQTDKLNFRGKYRQYDVDGKPYLYRIGDSVELNGKIFVAVIPTSSKIPNTQEGSNYWKEVGGNYNFFIKEPPAPANSEIGDRWYVPSSAIMYTYVKEESNKFWVEL
jgi:hypothetical protein